MINPWRKIYDLPESVNPWEFLSEGTSIDFALYLDVEPTNHCNMNCAFCVAKQQMKRPKDYMDIKLFEEICKQAEKFGSKGIRFLRWGEPLLHKQIDKMIIMAKDHKQLTHITTNGFFLDDNMCVKLIEAGLDSIIISMQGTNEGEYSKLRGSQFETIADNVERLRKI